MLSRFYEISDLDEQGQPAASGARSWREFSGMILYKRSGDIQARRSGDNEIRRKQIDLLTSWSSGLL